MIRTAIIMAGGAGERFWPLSRLRHPKQLLKLNHPSKTMIEESIDRIVPLIPKENIFIITSELLVEPMRNVLKDFPHENIIPEPAKRNTAPCLALGTAVILAKFAKDGITAKDISIAVLTADQAISPDEDFVRTVDSALNYAETKDSLVTIGIIPDRPETGYGYVETQRAFSNDGNPEVFPVVSFREKPALEAAKEYVASGRFLWNSGMFFWRADTFINEMSEHLPVVGSKIDDMTKNLADVIGEASHSLADSIGEIFSSCPSISIDFGLMEKSSKVAVAKALFTWDDVGAWDALRRTREMEGQGNISSGDVSLIDTSNSIVINESNNHIITAVVGMDNIAVIVTGDAVLVCPIDKVQDVKRSVEHIRSLHGGEKWL